MSVIPAGSGPHQDARAQALHHWFASVLPSLPAPFTENDAVPDIPVPVSGDASFRRYFRGFSGGHSCILMDAPPELENSEPFVRIAQVLKMNGVNVPRIFVADLAQGFLCLEDFGSDLYLKALHESGQTMADGLYAKALDELLRIQLVSRDVLPLPDYDEALLQREMGLFRDWFCRQLLGLSLSSPQEELLQSTFDFLCAAALAQPKVCVHRDYHSRNLMDCGEGPPGVLDFQDAVWGPVTYDPVSLLKDCYIAWPRDRVLAWLGDYRQQAQLAGIIPLMPFDDLLRDFDLMGVQRHLKAIGIFSRLKLRDGKPGYLKDIPRTLDYILTLEGLYPQLDPFIDWCRRTLVPGLPETLQAEGART